MTYRRRKMLKIQPISLTIFYNQHSPIKRTLITLVRDGHYHAFDQSLRGQSIGISDQKRPQTVRAMLCSVAWLKV